MKKLFFEYRGIGMNRFVPWVVELVILPAVLVMLYRKYGPGLEFGGKALYFFLLLLPMFTAWWNICILQQYVENEGNEIYFLYKRSKLGTVLKHLILYCIPVCILYGISGFGYRLLWSELPVMLVACFFINGVIYLFLMLVPSSIMAILLSVGYPLYVMYFHHGGRRWFIYWYKEEISMELVLQALLPMLIAAVCFYVAAYEINIRRRTYS